MGFPAEAVRYFDTKVGVGFSNSEARTASEVVGSTEVE